MMNPAASISRNDNAETADPERQIDGLGPAIRRLRQERGISAAALARDVGVSASLVSQIERRVTTPSIEVLWAIARALQVPMGTFFQEPPIPVPMPSQTALVVRADQRKRIALPGVMSYDLLSPDLKHQIEFVWAEFEPGESSPSQPYSHAGEEQLVVIAGELHFWVDGEEFVLAEGDSITIDSGLPHRAANLGNRRAIMIAAMTPPSF